MGQRQWNRQDYLVFGHQRSGRHGARRQTRSGGDHSGAGTPTGQVFNSTTNFHRDQFLFVSEDGTISGWRGTLGTVAEILTNRPSAVYKGVALVTAAGGPVLLAANSAGGTVDAFDGSMNLVGELSDPDAPAGYAPFNVVSLEGMIFVTFAKQDAAKHDDDPGPGHGLIDVLDLATQTFHRFATGSDAGGHFRQINSPWGVALAPATFGEQGADLLVGNFGSGTIMAFGDHARFEGLLEGGHEKPVVIPGLWALAFGNGGQAGVPGTLYFTAGPDGESHGLLGGLRTGDRTQQTRSRRQRSPALEPKPHAIPDGPPSGATRRVFRRGRKARRLFPARRGRAPKRPNPPVIKRR